MSEIILEAERRTAMGKAAKRVRTEGKIPGVYYSHGEENIPLQVPRTSLDPLIYTSETHVIELRLKDGTKKAILRDVQFDPVTDRPIHFDLQGLREDEKVTLEVPVVLTGGTPIGVREGGLLQHIMHKVKVSCLPKHIPSRIEVNVSQLGINKSVHVRDLSIPEVTILEAMDDSVVAVVPPTVHKEEAARAAEAVAEAPQEPEVVGKGKKAEEGAEGEAKPEAAAKEEKKKPA
jgi:large subunit ribosomal protein L25